MESDSSYEIVAASKKPKYIPPAMRKPEWVGAPPPIIVRQQTKEEILEEGYYPDHLTGGEDGNPNRIYGEYVSSDAISTKETVARNVMSGFSPSIIGSETSEIIYPEVNAILQYSNKNIAETVKCPHKVRSKSLKSKCDLCDLLDAIKNKFRLYSSNMHPKIGGRDKVYRWNCCNCRNDLFATKEQIKYAAKTKAFKFRDENSNFISDCQYLHSWSNLLPEYVQQTARRVFEVVTGVPCDDSVPTSSLVCYNINSPFAIFMPDAFTYVNWQTAGYMKRLCDEAVAICTENAKHLMIVERFSYGNNTPDASNDSHSLVFNKYMKTEVFITCLYNFLLGKNLLQPNYMPKSPIKGDSKVVRFDNNVTYSQMSYVESMNRFVFTIMRLLESQIARGIMYTPRPNLRGSNEFIIHQGEYY